MAARPSPPAGPRPLQGHPAPLLASPLKGRRDTGLINHSAPGGAGLLARPHPRNVLLPVNTFIFNCRCWAGGGKGGQELVGSGCLCWLAVNSPGSRLDSDVSIRAPAPRQPPCGMSFFGAAAEPGSGPTMLRFQGSCTQIWPVGASFHPPCLAGVMACMPSPSCAMPGRGAFWGEEEAFGDEGEVLEQGCV